MEKKEIRMLFNSCTAAIENVRDTRIMTQEGQIKEIGVCLVDNSYITYSNEEDVINFYNGIDDSLLTIDSTNPLLWMFKELINLEKDYRENQ